MEEVEPPLSHGRYRLVSELGKGGMATVYRGYDAQLEQWRAIKVLAPELSGRRSLRERFGIEARTMAKLHHPNIVGVLDVGVEGNRVYMVMELVRGGCLIDRVESHGPLPPRMATEVILGVCEGLSAAHKAGVVHRDVKPHNVLITESGVPKVTDFGIAKADDSQNMTKTGTVMGTWAYMAPEQRMGAKGVDARADLYALAATLYAVVCGRQPVDLYAAEAADEIYAGIPDSLTAVIRKGSAYKADRRYQSADEFASALRAALEELPTDDDDTPLAMPAGALPKFDSDYDTTLIDPTDVLPKLVRQAAPPADATFTAEPIEEEPLPDPAPTGVAATNPLPERLTDPTPSAPVQKAPPLPPFTQVEAVSAGPYSYGLVTGGVSAATGPLAAIVAAPRVVYFRLSAHGAFTATNLGATNTGGVEGSIALRPEADKDHSQSTRVRSRKGVGCLGSLFTPWKALAGQSVWIYELDTNQQMRYRGLLGVLDELRLAGLPVKVEALAQVSSNVAVPAAQLGQHKVWFYPDRIWIAQGDALVDADYGQLDVSVGGTRVAIRAGDTTLDFPVGDIDAAKRLQWCFEQQVSGRSSF